MIGISAMRVNTHGGIVYRKYIKRKRPLQSNDLNRNPTTKIFIEYFYFFIFSKNTRLNLLVLSIQTSFLNLCRDRSCHGKLKCDTSLFLAKNRGCNICFG